MDRHALWRAVERNYSDMEKDAPAGYSPVAQVFIAGRPTPLEIGQVQTSRAEDFPWILFVANRDEEGTDTGTSHKSDRLLFVHEGHIERVELSYRSGAKTGFRHTPMGEPLSDAEAL